MQNRLMQAGLRGLLVLTAIFIVLGLAGTATASTSYFAGTVKIVIGDLEPAYITGSGVATYTGSGGGAHVTTIAAPQSGIVGSDVVIVTDPEGIADNGILSIRITFTAAGGSLGPLNSTATLTQSKQGPTGTGVVRICLFVEGCGINLVAQLAHTTQTVSGLAAGAGVGGQMTLGGSGLIRISIDNRPWTILTASGIDQPDALPASATGRTFSGALGGTTWNYKIKTKMGFAHGPLSATSTVGDGTPASPGVIQFVAPSQTTTNITSTSSKRISNPNVLRYQMVPEPGMMLLIVSGAAGLVVLGRRRMKK